MTLATFLLALITATNSPSSDAVDAPVLLDFHAEWCGPCRQVRGAVKELIRKHYPVKSIDVDQNGDVAARYGVDSVPTFIVVDAEGRELDRTSGLQSAPPWPGSTWRPRPKPSRLRTPTPTSAHARVPGPTRMTTRMSRSGSGRERAPTTPTIALSRRLAEPRASSIRTRRRPSFGSRSSAPTRPASARGRSSTARPTSPSS